MKRIFCKLHNHCKYLIFSILFLSSTYNEDDYTYKLRNNRNEGLKSIPQSGTNLSLLSFMRYKEAVSYSENTNLKIRFFLNNDQEVYITAVEILRHGLSHYQMKPLKTDWQGGWQEFDDWPVVDVLKPLCISIKNIGVVARLERENEGSGEIAPIILYDKDFRLEDSSYSVFMISKNSLTQVEYYLIDLQSYSEAIPIQYINNISAGVPFEMKFNLNNFSNGRYQLVVKTKELGRTSKSSRQYSFYHL